MGVKLIRSNENTAGVTIMNDTIETFDGPLTGKKVRIFEDDSTKSGKNWEYIEE